MPVVRNLAAALLVLALGLPASAAEVIHPHRGTCLTKAEQRAAVATGLAVPLAQAIRSLRSHKNRAELVRARLCRRGDHLAYVLTLLARNGKVTRARIDAATGALMNVR